jgi:hypothetical protein
MSKKFKYILSLSLVVIVFMPMTIKLFDSAFHHHDHSVYSAVNTTHFQKYHAKCPIPDFVLSAFNLEKVIHINWNFFFSKVIVNDLSGNYYRKPNYSFSLRAPPLNSSL